MSSRFVPTRPASSRSVGCTLAVQERRPARPRSRHARKCQQDAEGVGFEPTEALRPQRFSRWRSGFAEARNFQCSRTFAVFVVPAHPASSRLVSTRWLYTWLYSTAIQCKRSTHGCGSAPSSASASSRPCRTARPSRSAPARSRARRAGFPWRSRHCARATRTSSRSVTSRPSPSRIGSPCRKRGCSRTPRPLAVARTIATELAGGEGECSTARGIAGSRSAEAALPSRSATSTRSPIRRSRYAGRGLWHLRKVAFERYWIGSGLERALAFRALWLGAAMLRLPVRL